MRTTVVADRPVVAAFAHVSIVAGRSFTDSEHRLGGRRGLASAIAVALLAAAVGLAGCGGDDVVPPAVVVGTITEIERDAGTIARFAVETDDGERYELHIAPDVEYGFDLQHLEQHRSTRQPVRCDVEERGGRLFALTIEDA